MANERVRTALLLAAGAGSRFWPYNVVRNKTAFPIANVPLIRRLADDLVGLGMERLIVVVGAGEASVRAALRGCTAEPVFVRQPKPQGTADAVMCAATLLDEDFLVVAADVATDPQNLTTLLDRFQQEHPPAAALIQPLGDEEPHDWLVAYPEAGRLRGVAGHSRGGQHRLGGIYAFRRDAIQFLRDNPGVMRQVPVGGMPPVESEIAQSLQLMIDEGETVLAVEASGYHIDLDKPWHILQANEAVIDRLSRQLTESVIPASSKIHDGADIEGRLVLGEHCTVGNRVVVKGDLWLGNGASVTNGAMLGGPVVVGSQTVIQDYCQIGGHSSLGSRGHYGHGAEFSGVALDTVYCYHYMEVWGVVGEAVDFGAATVCGNLRFDDGDTVWRIKGRPERPNNAGNAAYFGDHCRTGVNAIIMPGRRIGVYSVVGAGVVLYEDLPDRQMVTVKQELVTRPWGPERYGW
jgi:UDP-N-acetylglucosamine diphosphorylase / glucose-1-phosphate thymidylyltransferase / UDP-N-acetylgalactosamine diphosphorylase / glucosamine-1-phosphate N-acetyltransferase / galactosamine-1-phosphate N-acetyltransferase